MSTYTPWNLAEQALADARRRNRSDPSADRRRGAGAAARQGGRAIPAGERPLLRLVGTGEREAAEPATVEPAAINAIASRPEPIVDPRDPRWALAVRTAACLQGPVLPPEQRDALLRMGRAMGLSPFEANLTIAIVQDQARRGVRPDQLASSAEPQLRMIPVARLTRRRLSPWQVAYLVAGGLALEIAIVWLLLG